MNRLALATVLAWAVSASANAAQVTFQGLTGSSRQADVLRAFPGAKHSRKFCREGQAVGKSPDGDFQCDLLEVNSYKVGDTDFRADFIFSTDRRLTQVLLMYFWPSTTGPEDEPNYSVISNKFEYMSNLLELRYGQPEKVAPCITVDDPTMRQLRLCGRWLGRKGQPGSWDTSEGLIELNVNADKEPGGNTYEFASLSITYHLVPIDAAGRL